jgi:transposase
MSLLDEKTLKKIRDVYKETGSIRKTANRLGVSRNAVRRELRGSKKGRGKVVSRCGRPSKLDPYKAKIRFLVEEKKLSGVRVLQEIELLGYQGGSSILNDYIRTIRPPKKRGLTMPIVHQPGHEGQMDWSVHSVLMGGKCQSIHIGSMVLCFSRWLYIHFYVDETLESVIDLHKRAFNELGAVPATVTYDNMTTVGFHRKGEIWINPQFQAFARDYGFQIIILRPGAKDRHGIVERPFHYIQNNFLAGREFEDLDNLNSRGDRWRMDVANIRIHGTLRERPLDRLKREQSFLQTLPHFLKNNHYKEVKRVVSREFCICLDTNHYSVSPDLFGKDVLVRLYADHLEIWIDKRLDCRHTYCKGKYQRQVLPEHEKRYREMTHQKSLLKTAFLRLGQVAHSYYEGLKKEKRAAAGYHLQRILKLVERYGGDVVSGALATAQQYGAYSSDAVLRIIHGKRLKQKGKYLATQTLSDENTPESVRAWLKACAVEKQELKDFDRMLSKITNEEME